MRTAHWADRASNAKAFFDFLNANSSYHVHVLWLDANTFKSKQAMEKYDKTENASEKQKLKLQLMFI